MHKLFKCLSKVLDFNILKIIGYNCESLKAIQNTQNCLYNEHEWIAESVHYRGMFIIRDNTFEKIQKL
jgi:hypothetical protein